ncbi:nose resistant to fluoxetine protein 6 [Scaptodrosophila lebanonensis]|uniref:Nose resistant to fluoxetine protein 6 n=1 Tax=Drosophila lebanonensis TaxID=7225 RepID=A0A6J2TGI3_DROLE|nr:nose resistant to fluoxetine protein 6 [Scaptodrosophila lebanonensis]
MPPMYQLEDYDLCLQKPPSQLLGHSTYCLVYAEIVPNASSALWHEIDKVSQNAKHNFRHDHLFLGVCLERCKRALSTLSRFQIQQLYEGKAMDKVLYNYYAKVHKRDTDERLHYDHLVNSCLNRQYGRQFHLRLRSTIEYCVSISSIDNISDSLDVVFYTIFGVLVFLNVASTFYDYRLKLQQPLSAQNNTFYQEPLKTSGQKLFSAFSLCRNYYRLVLPHASDFSKDLRFFDAFRVIGVFIVILGHTLMIFMTVPVQNTEFFEQLLNRFETSIYQNGSAVIQIFFVMSAFLLYINFTDRQLINKQSSILTCIGVYFRVFLVRYFRLLPSLVLLILFNGTMLTRLQDGPFWRHITEAERTFCRENWWKNLLFVNNYLLEESCAQQTWYMAADMQLFELFLINIIIAKKHPKIERFMNGLLIVLSFAVPALLTYFLKLEAVYHAKPETYRYLFFRDSDTFYQTYPPFYTNIGGYCVGFFCGKFYLKNRSSEPKYRGKLKYELGMWLLIPAVMIMLSSGYIFIKNDFEKPSIWLALYAGLYKNVWILVCAGFICCMCVKLGWLAYDLCVLSVFRPMARMSFQAFLWHVAVLRLVAGYMRQPIYINRLYLFSSVILVFILTQLVAFVVSILVEYPLVQVTKLMMIHGKSSKKNVSASERPMELEKI